MDHLFLSVFISFCIILGFDQEDRSVPTYDLEEAMEKELIKLSGIDYVGDKSISLRLENVHKKKDIKIRIRTGMQFASIDTLEQDQIILKGRTVLVKAGSKRSPKFLAYCTQSDHLSPGQGSSYQLKPDADGKLMQLASFLAKIKDVEYTAQQAIWVITNDHDLKGLHHEDLEKAVAIQEFVSDLSDKPLPEYTVRYKESRERQTAFLPETISLHGAHEYDLTEEALFTCKIYNETGEEVKEVFSNMRQGKGHVRFTFHLQTTRLPKGKYVSKVFKGEQLFDEIWMES